MSNPIPVVSFPQAIRFRRASPGAWLPSREAALNWLALGLLLAAWNAADSEPAAPRAPRPAALKGYAIISARAAYQQITGQ